MDSDKVIELYDFDSEESRKAILNMNALIKNKLPLEAKQN